MLLFLSGLPNWLSFLILVALPTILAMAGPIIVRRYLPLEQLTSNNEIAGFKFATVGVIYSVLVAFAVIVVWERFNDAQIAVAQEAGAAATLYHLTDGTEPHVVATRAALTTYLKAAIEHEWPAMSRQTKSRDASQALGALYTAILAIASDRQVNAAIASDMFRQADTITQSRRTRLHLATGVVPGLLWGVLFSGAILTVGFTFFFGTRNLRAQVLMTGILSFLAFMALFVIVAINYPFTGPTQVDSEPLRTVIDDFGT